MACSHACATGGSGSHDAPLHSPFASTTPPSIIITTNNTIIINRLPFFELIIWFVTSITIVNMSFTYPTTYVTKGRSDEFPTDSTCSGPMSAHNEVLHIKGVPYYMHYNCHVSALYVMEFL